MKTPYDLYNTFGQDSSVDYFVTTTMTISECESLSSRMNAVVARVEDPSDLRDVCTWLSESHRRGATIVVSHEEGAEALRIAIDCGAKELHYGKRIVKISGARRSNIEMAALSLEDPSEFSGQNTPKIAYRVAAVLASEVPVVRSIDDAARAMSEAQPAIDVWRAREMISYFHWRDEQRLQSMSGISRKESDAVQFKYVEFDEATDDIIIGDPSRVYLAIGSTGSGKTKTAERICERMRILGKGSVVTGPRRSILKSTFKDLPYYEDVSARIDSGRGKSSLRVCIPSMRSPRYKHIMKRASVLIVDEISQTLRDIFCGEMESPREVLEDLRDRIKNSELVYLADADAGDMVLDFILSTGRPVTVLCDRKKNQALSGVEAEFVSSDHGWARIMQDHKNGESIYCATDSKREAQRIAKKLRDDPRNDGTMARVLLITADTILDDDVRSFLDDPDNAPATHVVASPAAQSGLSITSDRFTKVHLSLRGVASHTDCVQMFRRVRRSKHVTIGVDVRSYMTLGAGDRINAMKSITDGATDFDAYAEGVRAEQAFSASRQGMGVWMLLESQGATCRRAEDGDAAREGGKHARRSATQLERAEHDNSLLAAKPLTPSEAKALRSQGKDRTSDQSVREERYLLEKTWGLPTAEISRDHVRIWRRGMLASQKSAWEHSIMTERAARQIDANEASSGLAASRRSYAAERSAVARIILDCLCVSCESGLPRGQFDSDQAAKLIVALAPHRRQLSIMGEEIRISSRDAERAAAGEGTWTRRASSILESVFGLKTSASVFRGKDGKQRRCQVVDEEHSAKLVPMLSDAKII